MTEMEDTMINIHEVLETNDMIEKENLDVRTITLGISLLSCCDNDLDRLTRYTIVLQRLQKILSKQERQSRKSLVFQL